MGRGGSKVGGGSWWHVGRYTGLIPMGFGFFAGDFNLPGVAYAAAVSTL